MKKFCIIGLGRFGFFLSEKLKKDNFEVIVIDINEKKLDEVIDFVDEVYSFDATNKNNWETSEIDIKNIDSFVISIGEYFEKNIYTTMILNELEAKNIFTRASNKFEEKIINKLNHSTPNSDISVFMPERLAAKRWSRQFLFKKTEDVSAKLAENFFVIKYKIKKNEISIIDSKLREKYELNIVLIKRDNESIVPKNNFIIQKNDILFLAGKHNNIQSFLRDDF